jgi:hypothetical protein
VIYWSECEVIKSIPGKLGGSWVFKGALFENLASGASVHEVSEWFDVHEDQPETFWSFFLAGPIRQRKLSRLLE